MIHTTKQYPSRDATAFHVLGRVLSGTGNATAVLALFYSKGHPFSTYAKFSEHFTPFPPPPLVRKEQ